MLLGLPSFRVVLDIVALLDAMRDFRTPLCENPVGGGQEIDCRGKLPRMGSKSPPTALANAYCLTSADCRLRTTSIE